MRSVVEIITSAASDLLDVDQSIPRAGITDKVLMRGLPPKDVTFVDPVFIDGQVVRRLGGPRQGGRRDHLYVRSDAGRVRLDRRGA
jgi:hypothetical protein